MSAGSEMMNLKCDQLEILLSVHTSPNEDFEYGNPHSNALLQFFYQIAVLQSV